MHVVLVRQRLSSLFALHVAPNEGNEGVERDTNRNQTQSDTKHQPALSHGAQRRKGTKGNGQNTKANQHETVHGDDVRSVGFWELDGEFWE